MFIFWDLKKAFDKVPRPAMWAVLKRYGCPPDFVKHVRALHDEMVERVCHQNSLSGPFPINGGLKQGLRELQYADDNATPGLMAEDLQSLADVYNSTYERFGMQVNTVKTKTLV
ncbi:uncharacterized protein [Palaemon carinicauda]|uniref:uncharacterized protein n=1 Tax=Palaemon carinicauda TaxID=392227 RepID=UPI0035B57978